MFTGIASRHRHRSSGSTPLNEGIRLQVSHDQ